MSRIRTQSHRPRLATSAFAASLIVGALAQAQDTLPKAEFGEFEPVPGQPGAHVLQLAARETNAKLNLPTPFPHIVRATLGEKPFTLEFNEDATQIVLDAPAGDAAPLRIEIAENTVQHSDGRIAFSALDASVVGETAKLETHSGNHRIGFCSNPKDAVKWDYKASRPGMYNVALTYSLASATSKVRIDYGDGSLETELAATGSWYRYTTIDAGRLYLEKSGKIQLTVTPIAKAGGAVMNLKAVLLTPAPEGDPIVQDGDSITLRSQDATTHGVKMRYEPKPQKNCLGYWANPADWASWTFTAKQAGTYRVKFTQGCGKGHGGSVVEVLLGGQKLEFTVEDTGGFQNWKELDLGSVEIPAAGEHRLEVRPVSKAKGAVMDIRKIVLEKQ